MVKPEVRAGADTLRATIEAARGELPRIAQPIVVLWSFRLYATSGRQLARVRTEHHRWRGVLLHGGLEAIPHPCGATGSYDGAALYVLEDGRLLYMRYRGGWNEVHARYRTRRRVIGFRSAAGEFPVEDCIRALGQALREPPS